MDLKSTYNRIAEDWDKDHSHDDWWVPGLESFVAFLKAGASVLDAGCGGGTKAKVLSNRGLVVTGIDFSEKMIEIAKRKVPAAEFFVADLYDLSAIHQKFDGIFSQAVLLHFPKKDAQLIIHGLIAKLNQGGYFYVAVKEVRSGKPDEEIIKENDYGYEYERPFTYFTASEIKEYFEKEGLKIMHESVVSSGRTNWIQIIGQYGLLPEKP